ncbi:MAG: 50S ribosomal protein L1 [Clostridia bacterium]|nr:50S ribosomal protein L1 [Clostridia bacterium]
MAARGKKHRDALLLVDRQKTYEIEEAFELLKKTSYTNFDATVDAAIRLGVDTRHADQKVRGTIVLPHGTGKIVRVLVFAKGEKAEEAKEAGADYVGAEDLAEKIEGGWLDFDVAIASPDMMGVVGKLGRVLGPRGMMPNPKVGTVTNDVGRTVQESKAGRVEYNADKTGVVHVPIGKVSFEVEKLAENYKALIEALLRARPPAAKGQYLRRAYVSATMGPGIKIVAAKSA